jgi:hypothetical protein
MKKLSRTAHCFSKAQRCSRTSCTSDEFDLHALWALNTVPSYFYLRDLSAYSIYTFARRRPKAGTVGNTMNAVVVTSRPASLASHRSNACTNFFSIISKYPNKTPSRLFRNMIVWLSCSVKDSILALQSLLSLGDSVITRERATGSYGTLHAGVSWRSKPPHPYCAFRLGIRKYRLGGVLFYAKMQTWYLYNTGDCAKLLDRGRCQLFV